MGTGGKFQLERRRSQRIMMRIPGRVYGARAGQAPVYEDVATETVSAHGALVNVQESYTMGMTLLFTNLVSEQEVHCKVVFVGETKEGQKQIAFEFTEKSPRFWGIHFPPPDEKPLKRPPTKP